MVWGCVVIALVVRGTDDFLSKIGQSFENPRDDSKLLKIYKRVLTVIQFDMNSY